jgi:predicted RNA methylase
MLHVGLLREKQIEVIDSFKRRYVEKFGLPLPVFVPEACIQAVQPVQQNFVYEGCYAAAPVFQNPLTPNNRTVGLADPVLYQSFTYDSELELVCHWHGTVVATSSGSLNALRFVTKNILAICLDTSSTIDWHNAYLVLPLTETYSVEAGHTIEIKFSYPVGAPLEALQPEVDVIHTAAQVWQHEAVMQHSALRKRTA